ncbi:CopG family transcriptional regulator [Inquilinus sp. CA228]|uniref:ribbon-helix-helix domain-containing protein n=1 Tax=Inquilinus sp. CA228 TaxID=3455609 RepID=UPI003F8CFBFF
MRTLVDIPDEQLEQLTEISTRENTSRAAIIREAIAGYLAKRRKVGAKDAFGLWRREGQDVVDGVEYQKALRGEW